MSQLPLPDGMGLLPVSTMPVGMDSSNRNYWLVDIPLPEEGGYSLSLSGIAPQRDSSRGLEACIPYPHGNMPLESICSFEPVHLNRITLRESALPFQVWTLFNRLQYNIPKIWFAFIPLPSQGVFLLTSDKGTELTTPRPEEFHLFGKPYWT